VGMQCWSMMGMSGHESAGPLRAYLISSAGTLTHVELLVTALRAFLSLYPNNSQ
jgi:hypothetical protein